jgi:hypothetical protein
LGANARANLRGSAAHVPGSGPAAAGSMRPKDVPNMTVAPE